MPARRAPPMLVKEAKAEAAQAFDSAAKLAHKTRRNEMLLEAAKGSGKR